MPHDADMIAGPGTARVDPPPSQAPTDPHPWRPAVVVTVATAALFVFASVVVAPRTWFAPDNWWQALDLWNVVGPARFVAAGAFAFLYEGDGDFVAMPLYATWYAPAVAFIDATGLTLGTPIQVPKPTSWPVLLVWSAPLMFPAFFGVRRLAVAAGARRGLARLQLAVVPLVMIPAGFTYGHYEDIVMIGCVAIALALLSEERRDPAAALLAVALSTKQLAVLALPVLLLAVPREARARFLTIALVPPALLGAIVLAADWTHASANLLSSPTYTSFGHRALYVPDDVRVLTATPYRWGALVAAVGVALWLRPTRSVGLLSAGVAVAFLLRVPFEAVLHPYYLSPALAFAAVYELVTRGTVYRTTLWGVTALAFCSVHLANGALWWAMFTVFVAAATWRVVVAVARRDPTGGLRAGGSLHEVDHVEHRHVQRDQHAADTDAHHPDEERLDQ